MKQRHPFCWDVKQCHIQEEKLCLILNTSINLKTCMRSVRLGMDFKEGSQGLFHCKGKGKTIQLEVWTDPEVSRRLRLPDFKTISP
jgi:hypothetical protein